MGRVAIAVALLTTAAWAQAPTWPSTYAPADRDGSPGIGVVGKVWVRSESN